MNKIYYVGLEKLKSRYTYQLTDWNVREFERLKVPYHVVEGGTLDGSEDISLGQVLDAYNRPYYALSQIQNLIGLIKYKTITSEDVIFFEDMFHPGIESLFYIFSFLPKEDRPKIVMRCLAQTIDPDDFVHKAGMEGWMRKYEEMCISFVDSIFVASQEMLCNFQIAGWNTIPVVVTGLPFGKQEVQSRASPKPWLKRKMRVVFAARTDEEKMPEFFIELAELFKGKKVLNKKIEFVVLSGKGLTSNNKHTLKSLQDASKAGTIKIVDNLSKNEYYDYLADSKVLFNCALQDWVSNTLSEADALGCNVLYPAYRSFPEALSNDETRLYVPWSLADAERKLSRLLIWEHPLMGKVSDLQDATIANTIRAISQLGKRNLALRSNSSWHADGILPYTQDNHNSSTNLENHWNDFTYRNYAK